MGSGDHYLKRELFELVNDKSGIFGFLQLGSLDGIWYWDLEAPEHEWMSPEFWRLFGYDADEKEHLASEWKDIIFPEDLEVAIRNFKAHCASLSHPYDQVVRYHHRDGSTVWVRCRGLAIRDDDGRPRRMLGAHTDLSALMRSREALRRLSEELELSNRELRQAADQVASLEALLPICMYCKKIRDSGSHWQPLEEYISSRTGSHFSHGLCPRCAQEHFPEH